MKFLFLIFVTPLLYASNGQGEIKEQQFKKLFEQMDSRFEKIRKSMDEMMGDDSVDLFGSVSNVAKSHGQLETKWTNAQKGKKNLVITMPENHKLDVKVQNSNVTISGDLKVETVNKTKYGESKSITQEHVSRQFPLPQGCDEKNYAVSESKKNGQLQLTLTFHCKEEKMLLKSGGSTI